VHYFASIGESPNTIGFWLNPAMPAFPSILTSIAKPSLRAIFRYQIRINRYITDSGALGGDWALGSWRPLQWRMTVIVGFVTIAVTAFMGTLLIYDRILRRNNLTRFLFGRKLLSSAPCTVTQTAAGRVG
jgi:hypothetical protein